MRLFKQPAFDHKAACHPERSEGSLTGHFDHASYVAFAQHPMRDPSPSGRLGMTAF
jgi:hypothetical protein